MQFTFLIMQAVRPEWLPKSVLVKVNLFIQPEFKDDLEIRPGTREIGPIIYNDFPHLRNVKALYKETE